jgi:hypothetical protein
MKNDSKGKYWDMMRTFLRIKNLVNYNIMCIYLELGEFLHQSLSFIERKELWNADTEKGCQVLPTRK